MFGQALVATEKDANLGEAIKNLTVGLQKAPDVPVGWRTLARAYALKGDLPMAELSTAEERFVIGNYKEAAIHATRAQERLKPGSPAWLRAEDILTYKPPNRNRRHVPGRNNPTSIRTTFRHHAAANNGAAGYFAGTARRAALRRWRPRAGRGDDRGTSAAAAQEVEGSQGLPQQPGFIATTSSPIPR
jgi:hypothetical protein